MFPAPWLNCTPPNLPVCSRPSPLQTWCSFTDGVGGTRVGPRRAEEAW